MALLPLAKLDRNACLFPQNKTTKTMKHIITIIVLSVVGAVCANAQDYHYRSGYVTRTGTVVGGSYQTNPNSSRYDNWSTQGNQNPFTGQSGYKSPYTGGSGGYSGGYNSSSSGYRYGYGR